MKRHINVDMDDTKPFDQGGQIDKTFNISTGEIINSITKNIDTKSSAVIENIQIETLQLYVALANNNTASSLHNIHIKLIPLTGPEESVAKFDSSHIFINQAVVVAANTFLIFKGVSEIKKGLNEFLVTKKETHFQLRMNGFVPSGQVFRGSIRLVLKASFDAKTCERVPIGFGPSECF